MSDPPSATEFTADEMTNIHKAVVETNEPVAAAVEVLMQAGSGDITLLGWLPARDRLELTRAILLTDRSEPWGPYELAMATAALADGNWRRVLVLGQDHVVLVARAVGVYLGALANTVDVFPPRTVDVFSTMVEYTNIVDNLFDVFTQGPR